MALTRVTNHECPGRIVDVGEAVTEFVEGDPVAERPIRCDGWCFPVWDRCDKRLSGRGNNGRLPRRCIRVVHRCPRGHASSDSERRSPVSRGCCPTHERRRASCGPQLPRLFQRSRARRGTGTDRPLDGPSGCRAWRQYLGFRPRAGRGVPTAARVGPRLRDDRRVASRPSPRAARP